MTGVAADGSVSHRQPAVSLWAELAPRPFRRKAQSYVFNRLVHSGDLAPTVGAHQKQVDANYFKIVLSKTDWHFSLSFHLTFYCIFRNIKT
jgi:hypothetical protein